MLISMIFAAIISAGGVGVSYAILDDDAPLMWRLASGNVIGSAIFGTLIFCAALIFGLTNAAIVICLTLTLLPVIILRDAGASKQAAHDWAAAKSRTQQTNLRKFLGFAYYLFFFLLFVLFFARAMIVTDGGIFTGASQNLGDLPFHLGAITSFADGDNFPPQNPSFAGARFSYPFIADLVTACMVKLGASVENAMFVLNVSWAFSLLIVLERFIVKLTGDRIAGRIGAALLFFSGGLGFFAFFSDFGAQGRGFLDFLQHIPVDYTIGDKFRWGNSMVVMFITQRSLLLGMPLTILTLGYLWEIFVPGGTTAETEATSQVRRRLIKTFSCGLLAGLLPLVHLHSLAALFVVGVFLFVMRAERWRSWLAFAGGVAVVALPELLWSMSGTATETSKFLSWHFGWDKGEQSFLWFWFTNTGIFIPVAAIGAYLAFRKYARVQSGTSRHSHEKQMPSPETETDRTPLLLFSLPFVFLFVVSNVAKLAPWEWDNIKVLIYSFVGLIPLAAFALSFFWRIAAWGKGATSAMIIVLCLSGGLDIWRTVSRQVDIKVFDRDAVDLADVVKHATDPHAVILNAPTYNTATALTGRLSVMRYPGHLSSHGIDYARRESDVKEIYKGGPAAESLMRKYGVNYVMISPEERAAMQPNEAFFAKYGIAAEAGNYRLYRVK